MGLTPDAVYEALPVDCEPIPFRDLCAKLGISFEATGPPSDHAAEVRRLLLVLNDDGRAEIVYGRGWHRTRHHSGRFPDAAPVDFRKPNAPRR